MASIKNMSVKVDMDMLDDRNCTMIPGIETDRNRQRILRNTAGDRIRKVGTSFVLVQMLPILMHQLLGHAMLY